MRRNFLILVLGAMAGVVMYGSLYLLGTANARALKKSPQPELAWLKAEFQLGEAEFQRIAQLHAGYLPACQERCRRIEHTERELARALAAAPEVTSEVERLLHERAGLRASCQAEMLRHFFHVSQAMPPHQGRRYLAWVQSHTCVREQPMSHGLGSPPTATAQGPLH